MTGNIRSSLLSQGYFPRELPPVFTSFDFGQQSEAILIEWEAAGLFKRRPAPKVSKGVNRRGSYNYELRDTDAETISKPKRANDRRDLHIVHPLPQLLLAHEIELNWKSISKWVARSEFSDDELQVGPQFERAVKSIDFDLHRKKKQYIEASSNWLLETDVTRFYHSIYTHSIPWAAHGKERVKSAIKTFSGSFADRLDALIRACNRNQTIGVPVGPETSRIIAEIISARIDSEVVGQMRSIKGSVADRLQDDWIVGVPTLEAAEASLTTLRSAYRSVGLEMNASKTHITRLVDRPVDDWVAEIRGQLLHRKENLNGANLADFLSMCLTIQKKYPSSSAISYALTITESLSVKEYDVKAMEAFLLRCAVVAPGSMDRICSAILNLENRSKAVSKAKVCNRLYEIAVASAKQGFTFETIWCLYTIRGLRQRIDARSIIDIDVVTKSSVLSLVLLDMKERGSLVGPLPTKLWANFSKDETLSSSCWLLAYEGIRNGWLPDPKNLAATDFFRPMLTRGVAFYDKRRNMPTVVAKTRKRNAAKPSIRPKASSPAQSRTMSFVSLADLLSAVETHVDDY